MADREHVAFMYERSAELRPAIGSWLAPILQRGGGALLICRTEHAALAREELATLGVRVETCEIEGRLVILDAERTLASFMKDGMPVGALFKRTARGILRQMRQVTAPGPIRAWGEMVDILTHEGDLDAAHRLEQLWNEIVAESDVHLLCTYSLDALDPATHAKALLDICSTHDECIPSAGGALDAAVNGALEDVFGEEQGQTLGRLLPARSGLLDRMSAGSAILVSLRGIHPVIGERVAVRARARILAQRAKASGSRQRREAPPG